MIFRIVWIDDRKDWVDSIRDDVVTSFELYEFEAEIKVFQSVQDASGSVDETYIDLFLVDYNLPDGVTGDRFILDLRSRRCFAEVLFYSQDVENINILREDKHFLHSAQRDDVTDIAERIAESAFRKYRNPAFMRGLLLSEYIDLENIMESAISDFFGDRKRIFDYFFMEKNQRFITFDLKKRLLALMLKEVADRAPKKVLMEAGIDGLSFSQNGFDQDIIHRRNALAHAAPIYDPDTGSVTLKTAASGGVFVFDAEWFHQSRELIHKYKKTVVALKAATLPDLYLAIES